jgi:DNA-directed RNA polymerase subunit RPC12/RpoP
LSIPNWICLECSQKFKPSVSDDDFDFNCPNCGSYGTIAHREKAIEVVSDSDGE